MSAGPNPTHDDESGRGVTVGDTAMAQECERYARRCDRRAAAAGTG